MANKLNKANLVESIAKVAEISKAEAERQLNNVIAGLEATLATMKDGDKLQLVGVLTFEVKHKPAYTAKNPKTGEDVAVPASNKLKVKAGKGLVDLVQ
jgi:DNA-binding protein HU-beta